jgi:hypothetical protein
MVRYRADRLAATVLLIHPDKRADGLTSAPLDHWYGWELGGLEGHVVVGSPQDVLCEPFVASVARCLEDRIADLLGTQPERSRTH